MQRVYKICSLDLPREYLSTRHMANVSGLLPSQSFWHMSRTSSSLAQKQQKRAPLIILPPLVLDFTSQHYCRRKPVILLCELH